MEIPDLITSKWLREHLDHPNLVLLDATLAKPKSTIEAIPNSELQIPGARYFDLDRQFSDTSVDLPHMMCSPDQFQIEANVLGIHPDSLIVIYDQHGIYSGPRSWWMFKSMGHAQVAILDGGLPDWMLHDFPTEPKNSTQLPRGNFEPVHQPACFVNADFVNQAIGDPHVVVLDARSKGRFDGTEPEPRAGLRSGHIPNSISLPFPEVLNGMYMKSVEELSTIFRSMNLTNKQLVFSCGSGLTACIILFAAYLTGYRDLSVYDGSWSEWGQENRLPVVTTD